MVESMCLRRWWKPGMVLVNAFVIQLVKGHKLHWFRLLWKAPKAY